MLSICIKVKSCESFSEGAAKSYSAGGKMQWVVFSYRILFLELNQKCEMTGGSDGQKFVCKFVTKKVGCHSIVPIKSSRESLAYLILANFM
ncbi:9904_t:CDS:2 [Gigaspora rosea]|nr:9904_t:CDS:2 [Gigaspora rosea]